MEIILASTSRYRKALLERLKVPFRSVDPAFDETPLQKQGLAPSELAQRLAFEKAAAVSRQYPQSIVIGSDQVAACEDKIFGKPGGPEAALLQLAALSGKEHQLFTAVAIVQGPLRKDHLDITRLWMGIHSEAALKRYLALDTPYDCAGSYKIESLGISLLDRVSTEDATSIEGLPMLSVCRMLREFGVRLP